MASIRISVGLLERLAGIKKEPKNGTEQQQQQQYQQQPRQPPILGGRLPLIPGDIAAALAVDPEVRHALTTSKRLGSLLLKAEEEESQQVAQLADELVKQEYSSPVRPVPCGEQRDACLQCYKENAKDVLKCADLVAAYATCAERAFEQWTTHS